MSVRTNGARIIARARNGTILLPARTAGQSGQAGYEYGGFECLHDDLSLLIRAGPLWSEFSLARIVGTLVVTVAFNDGPSARRGSPSIVFLRWSALPIRGK